MPPCDLLQTIFRASNTSIVSILVLVDAALRLCPTNAHRLSYHVSILVLVDAALRLGLMSSITVAISSFNPCFSGCRPATILHSYTYIAPLWFQSLF